MGVNALFTAVSGLDSNQTYLGVIGNNIANSNTIGFKSSSPIFENLVSQTLSGTSNSQEGLGTDVYSIQQQFTQGALQNTSNPLNMAVDGNGFFIVQAPNGSTYYTRNGTFSENAKGQIVDSTGQNVVQGYQLNPAGIATTGTPSAITLNTGAIAPVATKNATLTANLDSNVAAQTTTTISTATNDFMGGYITGNYSSGDGSSITNYIGVSNLYATGTSLPSSLLIGNGNGTTNLYDVSQYYDSTKGAWFTPTSGNFAAGDVITRVELSSALTSSISENTAISQQSLALADTTGISAGADIQLDMLDNGAPQFSNTVASVPSSGTIYLSNAMPVGNTSGSGAQKFTTGGSVIAGPASDYYSTTIDIYDSLGNALPLTVTFAPTGSTSGDWYAYYSIDGTAAQRTSLTSTSPDVAFSSGGAITGTTSLNLTDAPSYVDNYNTINLPDGAAAMPSISLDLANLTQYAATSATTAFTQDGYATGTLTSFTVDQNGRLSGQFSNGQTEYLYQVALANFISPTGLTSEGNSLYAQTFASGQPAVGVANSGNFGYITDSALEQSNVDISSEFTNMIVAQNAYVANSKVLTTENSVLTALESSVQ